MPASSSHCNQLCPSVICISSQHGSLVHPWLRHRHLRVEREPSLGMRQTARERELRVSSFASCFRAPLIISFYAIRNKRTSPEIRRDLPHSSVAKRHSLPAASWDAEPNFRSWRIDYLTPDYRKVSPQAWTIVCPFLSATGPALRQGWE